MTRGCHAARATPRRSAVDLLLSPAAAENFAAVLAAIWMVSPLEGLRPSRAALAGAELGGVLINVLECHLHDLALASRKSTSGHVGNPARPRFSSWIPDADCRRNTTPFRWSAARCRQTFVSRRRLLGQNR